MHVNKCFFIHISNQPMVQHTFNRYMDLNMHYMTCTSMRKGTDQTLNTAWSLLLDGFDWVFQKLQNYLRFHSHSVNWNSLRRNSLLRKMVWPVQSDRMLTVNQIEIIFKVHSVLLHFFIYHKEENWTHQNLK